jgi:hypothetical protein
VPNTHTISAQEMEMEKQYAKVTVEAQSFIEQIIHHDGHHMESRHTVLVRDAEI